MPETPFVFPNDPNVPWSIMIVLYPYITPNYSRAAWMMDGTIA